MSVTLDNIAAELGLSKSTVSLALRNHPRAKRFSRRTRQRITQTARRMGYQPNYFAAQLAKPRTNLLMVCVSRLPDTWAVTIAAGFEARAAERKHRMLLASFQHEADPLAAHRDLLNKRVVGGMAIVGGNNRNLLEQMVKDLTGQGIQVVLVGRELDRPDVGQVLCDSYTGAKMAAKHIYEQGLRKVWILTSAPGWPEMLSRRRDGFVDAAREAGAPPPMEACVKSSSLMDRGYEATRELLRQYGPPEAILSASDASAIGAMRALNDAGLWAGRDVAITGFDGGLYSECSTPPLTSVRQPTREMGQMAADMLIDLIERPDEAVKKVVLPTELLVRESSLLVPSFNSHPSLSTAKGDRDEVHSQV